MQYISALEHRSGLFEICWVSGQVLIKPVHAEVINASNYPVCVLSIYINVNHVDEYQALRSHRCVSFDVIVEHNRELF